MAINVVGENIVLEPYQAQALGCGESIFPASFPEGLLCLIRNRATLLRAKSETRDVLFNAGLGTQGKHAFTDGRVGILEGLEMDLLAYDSSLYSPNAISQP